MFLRELVLLWLYVLEGLGVRYKRQDFAMIPWSPLMDHTMNIVCPMQDGYLKRRDLSSLLLPSWVRSHRGPVGRCPVTYRHMFDPYRIWPQVMTSVVCACEQSRCTHFGNHVCVTVFVARTVIMQAAGITKLLVSVDCICASQDGNSVDLSLPKVVS